MNQLLNIGFDNVLFTARIVALLSPHSAPVKRLIQQAKKNNTLINAGAGRKTRAVIVMDTGEIFLAGIGVATLSQRLTGQAVIVEDKAT